MAIEITARSLADTQQADMSSGEAIQPRELSGLPERSIPVSRFLRRSLRWTRRNFSSRAKLLSGGEVLILSAPKSGRTWIRTFLCAYLCKRHGLEFTLQPGRYDHPGFPRVIFSHDRFEHRTKGNRWDRLRGKYLVLRRELRKAKIVLLDVVGEATLDMSIFQKALEFSRFENMQKLEAAGVFGSKILHPGDVRDPESFKVRRGKVGGFREYLSAGDQECAIQALVELDPRFGYSS